MNPTVPGTFEVAVPLVLVSGGLMGEVVLVTGDVVEPESSSSSSHDSGVESVVSSSHELVVVSVLFTGKVAVPVETG